MFNTFAYYLASSKNLLAGPSCHFLHPHLFINRIVFAQQDVCLGDEASLLSSSVTAIFVSGEAFLLFSFVASFAVAVAEIFVHAACPLPQAQHAAVFCALQEWNNVHHWRGAYSQIFISIPGVTGLFHTENTL